MRGCLRGSTAIPTDLGPSQLLLPWHLLHRSLKRRFGKRLPDVVWMRGILPRWREGMLDGLWMFSLALPFYNFVTHTWWDGKQTICGLSMPCCSVVPVTAAEFHWMTLGAAAGPVLLCFCRKLAPSDCLFISILGCCVQSCLRLLPWEFSLRYTLPSCRGFSGIPRLWQHLLLVVSIHSADWVLDLAYETD